MTANATTPAAGRPRSDVLALWGGILFSLAFTALIYALSGRLADVPHLPDAGASWYYWKLPAGTFWSRLTSWGFYALHQITIWGLYHYGQTRVKRFSAGLTKLNVVALAANAFFIVLHLIQTHIWYDGIAQDVSIWTSQGSVIVMLVLILLFENRRRGLFFGKKVPISQRIMAWARDYHGYIFSWAMVYTLWYHPMEGTLGHLAGFFYMFLLLLQASLMYTRVHLQPWWTTSLEFTVLPHGTIVALMQGNGIWPMFAFGFGAIFVITQMYGLGLPRWARWAIAGVYVVLALWVYSGRGWIQLNEIIRIPAIEYALVFVFAGLIWLGFWVAGRLKRQPA
jgi:hypothetical protein